MRILVVGSGGREHALCWTIAASPLCEELYCAPGNAGIAQDAVCVPIGAEDLDGLIAFAKEKRIDYVVVGPEGPLVAGLVDRLAEAGIKAFGPSAAAAALEGSKGFMKDLCAKYDIPTAGYRRFTEAAAARAYLRERGVPIVVKADGLAAGKGVTVATTLAEAEAAVEAAMEGDAFGAAGSELVIEDFLEGEEASFFALVDGETALALATAQDHKRVGDGDTGPNTGGMGAYSPAPVLTEERCREVMERIILPTVQGMKAEGRPYKGVLYAGLMVAPDGAIKLLEYNVRFGDPECQVLMMRLMSDLLPALIATTDGVLSNFRRRGAERRRHGVPRRHQGGAGRRGPGQRRARAGRHRDRTRHRRGPGPRLSGGRPHRLAQRLLPPRHRLARAGQNRGVGRAGGGAMMRLRSTRGASR
jgi:phosphoribosylamine--glycine ligase